MYNYNVSSNMLIPILILNAVTVKSEATATSCSVGIISYHVYVQTYTVDL